MMFEFDYYQPTKIFFGVDSFNRLSIVSSEIKPSRVLLVCGRSSMRKHGFIDKAVSLLSQAETEVYEGVEQDPSFETVDKIAEVARECELVVGVGGGSVLDAAKAAAVVAKNRGKTKDFSYGKKLKKKGIPFIAVPSTAGTGSEVTCASVLTDKKESVKKTMRNPLMFPSAAIVDPKLTLSCPKKLTSAVGIDALAHAVESYTSWKANILSDSFAKTACELIFENIEVAYKEGENLEARTGMSLGSLLAGLALNSASSGVAHRIAHAVGGRYHAPHGEILAQLLPEVLEFNMPACEKKLSELTRQTQHKGADALIQEVRQLRDVMNLPAKLSDFGVKEEDIPWIVEQSFKSESMKFNAREVTKENLSKLLKEML